MAKNFASSNKEKTDFSHIGEVQYPVPLKGPVNDAERTQTAQANLNKSMIRQGKSWGHIDDEFANTKNL